MTVLGNVLFRSRGDLDSVLRDQLEAIPALVKQEFSRRPNSFNRNECVASVVKTLELAPLVLDLSLAKTSVTATTFEAQDQFFGGTSTVHGWELVRTIPFQGHQELWDLRPNPYGVNSPSAMVESSGLKVGIRVRDSDVDTGKQYINDTVSRIQSCIDTQKAQIEAFNSSLVEQVQQEIDGYLSRQNRAAQILKDLEG